MNIPESITRCAVEGDLLKVVLDSRDSGSVPNARQLRDLRATVTATVPYLSPTEGMFVMPPFVFETNQVGQIINPESPDDALLIPATNQVHTPEFRYLVEVTSPDLAETLRWRAAAPAGGVLNLSRVVDPPAPEDIPEWDRVLSEVEAVRTAVQGLLTTTQGHASAAQIQAVAAQAARNQAQVYRDEARAVASGDIIDDVTPSPVMVFSSQKMRTDVGDTTTNLVQVWQEALADAGVAGDVDPAGLLAAMRDQIDDMQAEVDGKAPASHTHTMSQIAGLFAALDGGAEIRNLITNPSFENGATGWAGNGITITPTTGYIRDGVIGARQAQLFPSGSSSAPYMQASIPIGAGVQWFAASARIGRSTGATHARVSITFRQGGTSIAYRHGPWTELSSSVLLPLRNVQSVPAGADSALVLIYPAGDATGAEPEVGGRTLVDAAMAVTGGTEAEVTAAVTSYFDGDSPSARWEGTRHLSVSVMPGIPVLLSKLRALEARVAGLES